MIDGQEADRPQDAIAKGVPACAERLMLEHLEHIERSMKLDNVTEEVDLEAIFKG